MSQTYFCPDPELDRSLRGRTLAVANEMDKLDQAIVCDEIGNAYFRSQVRRWIHEMRCLLSPDDASLLNKSATTSSEVTEDTGS